MGIIELLVDTAAESRADKLFGRLFKRHQTSIMPQAVAVWCRELGHRVFYATYYGQAAPERLLPDDLDVVFIAACTQASALASALAGLYRGKALTVIGGPHAKAFPEDCLPFFDLVVKECDKALIDDILRGRFDPPAIVASGRTLTDIPSVEERLPEIRTSAFAHDAGATGIIPILSSLGCPYSCNFCTDWNAAYVALPKERLAADLRFVAERFPRAHLGYHDPNFAVRFDETMEVIESVPERRRNRYAMQSSLAILKGGRLPRLARTNCQFVAPGVESFAGYSNKSGVGSKRGHDKLEQVIDHFTLLRQFVPGLQANFVFGTDVDRGREPAELIIEFIRRLPFVWPGVNIPTPYGATPLRDRLVAEGRILETMPLAFYFVPYLVTTLEHYEPAEYYDHLIDIYSAITSESALAARIFMKVPAVVRLIHVLRTFAVRDELAEMRTIRAMLASDRGFRAFHEGRSPELPEFYHRRFEQRLGRYAELVPSEERLPASCRPRQRLTSRRISVLA